MDREHESLISAFSTERMGPYLRLCGQDARRALALYDWNLHLSGAFQQSIGIVEIVVRNALASQLALKHGSRSGSWLDDPDGTLSAMARDHIQRARRRLHKVNRAERPSLVITELSFGFCSVGNMRRPCGPDFFDIRFRICSPRSVRSRIRRCKISTLCAIGSRTMNRFISATFAPMPQIFQACSGGSTRWLSGGQRGAM